MKSSLISIIFLISLSFASTFFISSSGGTSISYYNSQIEEVPPPLRFLLSGETANINILGLGNYYASFGDKGEVLEISPGSTPTATLEITLNKNTLSRLNSHSLNYDSAIRSKLLVFKSTNLLPEIKLQIAMSFIHLGGIWDSIFGPGTDKMYSALPF